MSDESDNDSTPNAAADEGANLDSTPSPNNNNSNNATDVSAIDSTVKKKVQDDGRDDPETPRSPTPLQEKNASTANRNSSNVNPQHNATSSTLKSTRNDSPKRKKNHGRFPPISSVSYKSRDESLTVADFLDPSKPLVKSTLALTKPRGPSFVEENTSNERKQRRAETKVIAASKSSELNQQRVNERKYLKAQYEFEREKKLAEKSIYHKERCHQWSLRLSTNPLAVDLVADNERIEEEAFVRGQEERHRKALAERKKRKIKNQIIVKALAEVPLLEEARRQKRQMVEEEKRDKALRDVQRVEAIQEKKLKDQESVTKERQAKVDHRKMAGTPTH